MTRRVLWALILLTGITKAAEKPNVIVIFTDDHGYADLSCQDIHKDIRTPNIDALAASGVRMTAGYVSAPQCVPSRAGLLSGRYQNRFGVESNGLPLTGFDQQQTIAERLHEAGYATGMTGKWHLGSAPRIVSHGFDDVYYRGGGWTNFDIHGQDVAPGTKANRMYHIDAESAAAAAFIRRHHEQPFFLYVAYRAPHVPLDATKKYLDRFPGAMPERRRQALAMLSAVDDGVGEIMTTIREFNLQKRTLVFVIGDNGAPLKIHKVDAPGGGPGWDGSLNDPLNGEKGMLSEGGIRVPFVVSWDGTIPPGQVYRHPVISLDVAATACALAGQPADSRLDGVNLMPFLTGAIRQPPHEILYWRWVAQSAVREGKWKYLRGGDREYLYDLDADPEEKSNLIAQHPRVAADLLQKLMAWSAELQPAGLKTESANDSWKNYFDYYLDGKEAVPRTGEPSPTEQFGGWLVRNGKGRRTTSGLQLRPSPNLKKGDSLFLAFNRVNLPAGFRLSVKTSSLATDGFAVQWREEGQSDFPDEQRRSLVRSVLTDPNPGKLQTFIAKADSESATIHVRLFVPREGATLKSVSAFAENGVVIKRWEF